MADISQQKTRQPTSPISFFLKPQELARIDALARDRGWARGPVIRWLLRRGLRDAARLPARRPGPGDLEPPKDTRGETKT